MLSEIWTVNFYYRKRKHELQGEIFEMLLTFSDFVAFKEMFIDYKKVSEEIFVLGVQHDV